MDRLKQLESFTAVATRGSLTAAAAAEGVAPAIIGRRIDALEQRLGVKLLVRTTRRLTLTHPFTKQELTVEAPLLELNRAEVIKLGDLMDVPFEKTWSCYVNNDTPCKRCLGCVSRISGFLKAGRPDPLLAQPVAAQ